jgi:RNA polymerase sigma-70 factor (sigma-E family)
MTWPTEATSELVAASGSGVAFDAWPVAGADARARMSADDRVGALFDEHYVSLCRMAYTLLGDPARAEDIVQEAFVRTFAGWGRLRDPGYAPLYLRRAVINGCRSAMRRRVTESAGNAMVATTVRAAGAEGFEGGRAAGMDLMAAVRALPPRQRQVVVLRYFLDLGEHEVAETMGINVGTVKSQLAKARSTLSASGHLGGRGDG